MHVQCRAPYNPNDATHPTGGARAKKAPTWIAPCSGRGVAREPLTRYVVSLAAVLRIWSDRPLTRTEVLNVLASVGLRMREAEAVLATALAGGAVREDADGIRAVDAAHPR
jgi:hypothetical protein